MTRVLCVLWTYWKVRFVDRDAVAIFIADIVTSFLSGAAIFAVLGFLAHETGHAIHDVVQAGSIPYELEKLYCGSL